MTGGEFAAVATIENAGNDAEAWPSETLMTIFENVPAVGGAPLTWPVEPLMLAQAGSPVAVNASESPFASLAVGVKL